MRGWSDLSSLALLSDVFRPARGEATSYSYKLFFFFFFLLLIFCFLFTASHQVELLPLLK